MTQTALHGSGDWRDQKILVLGGGFAGVAAAIRLRKKGYRNVHLMSDRDYFYLYPISIWIPVGKRSFEDVCLFLETLARKHGFHYHKRKVERIDAAAGQVHFTDGAEDYDQLIVAVGGKRLQPKGHEHILSICGNPDQSLKIKDALDEMVAGSGGRIAIGFGGNPNDKSAVRGGPAFELAFNLDTWLKKRKVRSKFELSFFAPMPVPGARMGDKPASKLPGLMQRHNISYYKGKKIIQFSAEGVHFEDNSLLGADLILFIPAGQGSPVFQNSDLPLNAAGFVVTNEFCEVEGFDNVYAVGDSAALLGPDWKAKQGHLAEVMADHAVDNLDAKLKGRSERKSYVRHINILCIMDTGRSAAFVYRTAKKQWMIPMPLIGHWIKQAWGFYYRNSRLKRLPKIPGM
ncbi:MAG: FAD-dependent oxidoreductase [Leptospiraceae bacterium]|nr:FAD-dependent oxidoreductase [Leptospiraceae bacterium]